MTENENPGGAVGASGASVGDMLGGNRTENSKPTQQQQGPGPSAVPWPTIVEIAP